MRLHEENENILEAYRAGIYTYCDETVCPRPFGADDLCAEGLGMENDNVWEALHDQWTHNLSQLDDSRRPILWASSLDAYNVAITVRVNKRHRARPLYIGLSGQTLAFRENGPLGRFIDLNTVVETLGLDTE